MNHFKPYSELNDEGKHPTEMYFAGEEDVRNSCYLIEEKQEME